jgi:hypothetical protein
VLSFSRCEGIRALLQPGWSAAQSGDGGSALMSLPGFAALHPGYEEKKEAERRQAHPLEAATEMVTYVNGNVTRVGWLNSRAEYKRRKP